MLKAVTRCVTAMVLLAPFLTGLALSEEDRAAGQTDEDVQHSEESQDPEDRFHGTVVVTASRKTDKKLEAPASIETVTEEDLLNSPATHFMGAVANLKGIDFVNGGITLQRVNARGFSSSFQSRMLFMVDGRLARIAGNGLPQGAWSPTVSLDIKAIDLNLRAELDAILLVA